jgi:hypothetical protein
VDETLQLRYSRSGQLVPQRHLVAYLAKCIIDAAIRDLLL